MVAVVADVDVLDASTSSTSTTNRRHGAADADTKDFVGGARILLSSTRITYKAEEGW
jgi:hypothetical protein